MVHAFDDWRIPATQFYKRQKGVLMPDVLDMIGGSAAMRAVQEEIEYGATVRIDVLDEPVEEPLGRARGRGRRRGGRAAAGSTTRVSPTPMRTSSSATRCCTPGRSPPTPRCATSFARRSPRRCTPRSAGRPGAACSCSPAPRARARPRSQRRCARVTPASGWTVGALGLDGVRAAVALATHTEDAAVAVGIAEDVDDVRRALPRLGRPDLLVAIAPAIVPGDEAGLARTAELLAELPGSRCPSRPACRRHRARDAGRDAALPAPSAREGPASGRARRGRHDRRRRLARAARAARAPLDGVRCRRRSLRHRRAERPRLEVAAVSDAVDEQPDEKPAKKAKKAKKAATRRPARRPPRSRAEHDRSRPAPARARPRSRACARPRRSARWRSWRCCRTRGHPLDHCIMRGLVAGIVGYFVGWYVGVTVWRQLDPRRAPRWPSPSAPPLQKAEATPS